jgi:ribosomal protein S18 acetylase RimI-like enzyme
MEKTRLLSDKEQILSYLETDRFYAAYAIGDLEPGMYEQSTFAAAERGGHIEALVLHFTGVKPPPLFLMGKPDGVKAILESTLHPKWVYLNCREEHLPTTTQFYSWEEPVHMWRMVLDPARFSPLPAQCVRLSIVHTDALTELYAFGGAEAFGPAQVPQGEFWGIFENGHLVTAAGTHLVSPTYGVAAVGNVFTHPEKRGRGLGTASTSAVIAALLQRGIRDIVLNVAQTNQSAIHVYEKLGFERYCPFLEGQANTLAASSAN